MNSGPSFDVVGVYREHVREGALLYLPGAGERCVSQERNIVTHQKLRFIEELVGASQEDIAQGFGCRARNFGVGG